MPKTIFNTTEKSNFILNLDLDRYRASCCKLLFAMLVAVAGSACVFQLTYAVNSDLSNMLNDGGFGGVLALLLISLRSISVVFSVAGVAAMIATVVGLMRSQFSKATAMPYLLVLGGLIWGTISLINSFDNSISFFGLNGRDEGLLSLLIYGCVFYLGSMLRRQKNLSKFVTLLLGFGIAQGVWGLLQSLPLPSFPNEYRMVDPLLYQNLYLPSGFTDSPITFAMLLGMVLAVAIPCAMLSPSEKQRTLAYICMAISGVLLLKTQTVAGVIAAAFAVILAVVLWCMKRKAAPAKHWLTPVILIGALAVSFGWSWISPSLNGAYKTYNGESLQNGYGFYDGGIVWDDGFYRLATSGPYTSYVEHDFDIYDTASVLKYCHGEGRRVIQKYPLVGTGPDNFTYSQLRSSMEIFQNANSIDRPYNDYLYIAATRGIPALVLYVALLTVALWLGIGYYRKTQHWAYLAAIGGVICFALTAFVGVSVLTVTPMVWMLLGVLVGEPLADAAPQKPEQSVKPEKSVKPASDRKKSRK
ncbi:MAG: O-antigen ligase family protein [Oscillospiraceae bacterium]|nr:O-antigen ligase family protein [Oscillospiraceae bacterium]